MLNIYEGLIATCPDCGDEKGICNHRWGNTPEGKAYLKELGIE